MNENRGRMFWGLALLLMGAVFLGFNLGVLPQFDEFLWAAFFGVLSLIFFITYFSTGIRAWGWLFPATILGALSAIIYLSATAFNDDFLGAIFMAAVAIPFWVAFFLDRTNWWAIIPAGVISTISLIILLSATSINSDFIGGIFMLGLGLIFILIYLLNQERWWAIIPGGVITTIGLTAITTGLPLTDALSDRIPPAIFFGGISLTFAILWLFRDKHDTGWGRYPAIPLGIFSLFWLITGTDFDLFWPVIMIGSGIYILLRTQRQTSS